MGLEVAMPDVKYPCSLKLIDTDTKGLISVVRLGESYSLRDMLSMASARRRTLASNRRIELSDATGRTLS